MQTDDVQDKEDENAINHRYLQSTHLFAIFYKQCFHFSRESNVTF